MGSMKRRSARAILIGVVVVWAVGLWMLNVGAAEVFGGSAAQATPCEITEPIPLPPGCEESPSPSPSDSQSTSPSRTTSSPTRTTSSPTSQSPSPSRSPSPSPSRTTQSPTPSSTQTTPPPPSLQEVDSRITIAHRREGFLGRVSSRNNRCERRRRVVLKRVKRGRDKTVSRDLTNRRGKWKIRMPNPRRGRYYATVNAKSFAGRNNRTIRCKRARSRRIRP
jgi:hypothetical protein